MKVVLQTVDAQKLSVLAMVCQVDKPSIYLHDSYFTGITFTYWVFGNEYK